MPCHYYINCGQILSWVIATQRRRRTNIIINGPVKWIWNTSSSSSILCNSGRRAATQIIIVQRHLKGFKHLEEGRRIKEATSEGDRRISERANDLISDILFSVRSLKKSILIRFSFSSCRELRHGSDLLAIIERRPI